MGLGPPTGGGQLPTPFTESSEQGVIWDCSKSGGLLAEEASGSFWKLVGLSEQDPKYHLLCGWFFKILLCMECEWLFLETLNHHDV